jgi:hypothetical protein
MHEAPTAAYTVFSVLTGIDDSHRSRRPTETKIIRSTGAILGQDLYDFLFAIQKLSYRDPHRKAGQPSVELMLYTQQFGCRIGRT